MTDTKQSGALYLRVRPNDFEDVLGNDAAVNLLRSEIGKPKATRPHVFALLGLSGGGKTTLARICARALGASESDIHERNCSKDTGKDAMDDLAESFQYMPGAGECSVYILDEAHFLSRQAWSTLLKPMEDCPAHVYIFVLTSEAHKVPTANMNRCLAVEVKPLDSRDALALIRRTIRSEGIELPKETWTPIIEASEGSSRQILQNVEKVAGALASGAETGEALALVTGTAEDAPGVKELYNALRDGSKATRKALTALSGQDPEGLRRGVALYANKVYLSSGDSKALEIIRAMTTGNTFDSGMPGLTGLCSIVVEG